VYRGYVGIHISGFRDFLLSRSFSVPSRTVPFRTADLNILPKASFMSLLLLLIIVLSVILALDAAELNISKPCSIS
jgi:hypothetical protein